MNKETNDAEKIAAYYGFVAGYNAHEFVEIYSYVRSLWRRLFRRD